MEESSNGNRGTGLIGRMSLLQSEYALVGWRAQERSDVVKGHRTQRAPSHPSASRQASSSSGAALPRRSRCSTRRSDMPNRAAMAETERPASANPARRCLAEPAVEQPLQTFLLVTPPIAPEAALRHPQQLRCIQSRKTLRLKASQHIVKLLHPAFLYPCRPVHPSASSLRHSTGQLLCYLNRTDHVLATVQRRRVVKFLQYMIY